MRKFGSLSAGVALAALLAGCATTESNLHTREAARVAGDLRQVAAQPAAPMNTASVQVQSAAYVGANVSRNLNGDPLPAKWDRETIQFARAGNADFQGVVAAITQATGIPIAVSTRGTSTTAPTATPMAPGAADATGLQAALGSITGVTQVATPAATGANLGIQGQMRLNYSGKLRGFLDQVASNFNLTWTFKAGQIVFSDSITRVFDVPALPIIANLSFDMSSKARSSEGETGTSAGQSASTQGGFDLWNELEGTIANIAGDGNYSMSPQTGQIVISASPAAVDRVSTYLRQLNAQLEKQVAISVNVYSVALSDNDNYSANISNILGNGISFTGGPQGINWAVVSGGGNGNSSSSSVINALSGRGDVSTVTSASVTALNGVPVPVQVANSQAYAKSVSVTQTEQGVTGSVETDDVTTGFNLHLVPKILNNGELLLQYGMNISELNSLENFAVPGGGNIQLPNTTQRNFIQQARIPNGATLVLAGFEQVRASTEGNGAGHSGLWPFGGRRESSMQREIIVIAITPVILDTSNSAQAAYAQ